MDDGGQGVVDEKENAIPADEGNTSQNTTSDITKLVGESEVVDNGDSEKVDDSVRGVGDEKDNAKHLVVAASEAVPCNLPFRDWPSRPKFRIFFSM